MHNQPLRISKLGSEHTLSTHHTVHLARPLNTNNHGLKHFSLESALGHAVRGVVFFFYNIHEAFYPYRNILLLCRE
ncbi:mCG148425 [Mus musculus]|nr:mCG148425 [Mus musculus]